LNGYFINVFWEHFWEIAENENAIVPRLSLRTALCFGVVVSVVGFTAGTFSIGARDLNIWFWLGLGLIMLIFSLDPRSHRRPQKWIVAEILGLIIRKINHLTTCADNPETDNTMFSLPLTKLSFLELAACGFWSVFCLTPWFIGGWNGGINSSFVGALGAFLLGIVFYLYCNLLLCLEKHMLSARRKA
jgi:hypothetical protein